MNEHPFSGGSLPSPNPGSRPGFAPGSPDGLTTPLSELSVPLLTALRRVLRARRAEEGSSFGAGVDPAAGGAVADGKSGSRRRRRGGRRGKSSASRGSTDTPASGSAESSNGAAQAPPAESGGGEAPAKRSRRGGRGRKRSGRRGGGEESTAGETPAPAADESAPAEGGERKRGSRRRRRSGKKDDEAGSNGSASKSMASKRVASSDTAADDAGEDAPAKKKSRKRGSRGGRRRRKSGSAVGIETIPGEDDDLPELAELPDDAVLVGDEKSTKKSRRRKRSAKSDSEKGSKKTRGSRSKSTKSAAPSAGEGEKSTILVNACDPEEERVVVVKKGQITDLQMTVKKHNSFVSDIYRGRVVNLESAIGAAFVDFGQGRNGFLHASDVLPRYGEPDWRLDQLLTTPVDGDWETDDAAAEAPKGKGRGGRSGGKGRTRRPRLPIEKLVKKGQLVAVQITKDAIGDKGPTLTTYISIPGRYLVLMPSLERTGVSRKIDDDKERRRLKRILSSLDIPDGMGVIVRTAGIGKTKAEIKRDLDYLLLAWKDFSRRLVSGRNPAPLYQESDVAVKTMRDLFTSDTEKVIVDDQPVYERMVEFTEKLMPEHVDRLHLHDGPRPLFHSHGVEQDFEKIFARRVDLPSGGSIVIDQTEALVAIDVNSGRTREAGAEFEDIALKTNLEAVQEIVRQIRLRDLGGIIVLDYIDMMRASSRRAVEQATRDAFKADRARSKIGRISQFGLLELTRQRLGPGLSRLVYETCIRCRGSGRQRNASSRAQAILRRLGSSLVLKGFTSVEVRAHPEVVDFLQRNLAGELERLERDSGRALILKGVADQVEDSIFHYLRADGREVRPGGRRKR